MQIYRLLDAAAAAGVAGEPLRLSPNHPGPVPISVEGTFIGTVTLECAIADAQEIREGTAAWVPVSGASWTAPTGEGLETMFPYIRAKVSAYTSGAITVKAWT